MLDPESFDILHAVREAAQAEDGLLFGLLGAISGGFMGYLRAKGQPFRARITEGFTCAMLSTALIEITYALLPQVSVHYFTPIGIFIGYLGSRFVGNLVYKTASLVPQFLQRKYNLQLPESEQNHHDR